MTTIDRSLPGAEIVGPGLDDLGRGAVTVNSLLVSMAAGRQRSAGLRVADPLVRRLVSFERAFECAR